MSFKTSDEKARPERVKPVRVPSPQTQSRRSSLESTSSFASAVEAQNEDAEIKTNLRFSPEEEARLVEGSNKIKILANSQFAKKDYSSALSTYDKALSELPSYLDYELAVLQSNIAACHIQLQEWKDAIDAAEKGLESLQRELPMFKPKEATQGETNGKPKEDAGDQAGSKVVELPEDNDDEANAEILQKLDLSDRKKADIHRIRTKLLLRRARAKILITQEASSPAPNATFVDNNDISQEGAGSKAKAKTKSPSTWCNLSGALEDYRTLAQPDYFRTLPTSDQKTVLEALRTLPPKIEVAKKKEVDEMMGKLKELGNGILKPFGLSTDMFKMTQDPNSGGWSMNFDGKAGK